jgi:hypothetical protein
LTIEFRPDVDFDRARWADGGVLTADLAGTQGLFNPYIRRLFALIVV